MKLSKVEVKEVSIVRPADAQDDAVAGKTKRKLWLSNLDLVHVRHHTRTVHIYAGPVGSPEEVVPTLRDALSKVMTEEYFYPAAGRLAKDEDGRTMIDCNSKGVLFLWAETDSTIDILDEFMPSSDLAAQLVPTVDTSGDISSYPLALYQVTFFKGGGMAMGIGQHHTLMDGPAAMLLINSWARMARGAPVNCPLLDHKEIGSRALPAPKFAHPEFDLASTIFKNKPPPHPVVTSTERFYVSSELLKSLKMEASVNGQTEYSSHEVFLAHVWRCASKARGLKDDESTRLYFPVDGKSRLRPPVSPLYFGNAVFPAMSMALSGDLGEESLSCTANRVHETIRRMDDEFLRSQLAFLEHNPEALDCRQGSQIFGNPNLSIVSWSRLPMNDADFGWGPATYVGPASISQEGKGYFIASSKNPGALSLLLTLEADHMQSFKKLFYEME